MHTDVFPSVSQLISGPECMDDDQRWERVVQLFGPGIRAWLQMRHSLLLTTENKDIHVIVDELFVRVKPALIRHLNVSTAEFSARLTGLMIEHLGAVSGSQTPSVEDTQSVQQPCAETRSFVPETNQISIERLMALLPLLEASGRDVAAMRWLEKLKYREIAARTNISISEVVRLDRESQSQLLSFLKRDEDASTGIREPTVTMDTTIDLKSRERKIN